MVCTDVCKLAKGDLCRCSCEGENHGMSLKEEAPEEKEKEEIVLVFESPQKTIEEWAKK